MPEKIAKVLTCLAAPGRNQANADVGAGAPWGRNCPVSSAASEDMVMAKKKQSGKKQGGTQEEKSMNKKKAKNKTTALASGDGTYSDGHPLDKVQYLEAKLILKPDRFTSLQSFRDFGKVMQSTAKKFNVGFVADPKTGESPEIREIVFGDTPDFKLYNNAFILRRRIMYVDGFPVGDPEIVFKFRHPDRRTAAALDVRPNIPGIYRVKFKSEVLPLKDKIGGYRVLYSHNCQLGLSQIEDADRNAMKTLGRIFPALSVLDSSKEERVSLVNESIVEEVQLPLGQLDFGNGSLAKCDVALWRTRGEHMPLVGEFSFEVKFDRIEEFHDKAKALCEQFYLAFQHEVADWISLGTTKTGIVYRLKGSPPQSHE